jgi:hypothetical protein
MATMVVLAVALMVMVTGVAVVAALQLKRAAGRFTGCVHATAGRLQPLVDEITGGIATTTTEMQSLQRSAERMKQARRGRTRRAR